MSKKPIEERDYSKPQNIKPREVGQKVVDIQDSIRYMKAEMKATMDLPDVRIDDTEEIKQRVWQYLDRCEKWAKYPSITGVAGGIGVDRVSVYNWMNNKPNHPTSKFLKKIQTFIAQTMETNLQEGKTNVIGTIFLLKSTCGYKEQNETTIVHKSELGDTKSVQEIEKEIDNTIIDAEFDEKE